MNRMPANFMVRFVGIVAVLLLIMSVWPASIIGAGKALTLDDVRRRGVLRVGMNAAYPPFEFIEGGQFKGFDIDLIAIFTRELGVKAEHIDTDWAGVIPALYTGKFDVIISGMGITPARAKRVTFSVPYADASTTLLVRASTPFQKPEDLDGRILATQLGAGTEAEARTWMKELEQKGKRIKDLLLFSNMPEAYAALDARRADAVVDTLPVLLVLMRKHPNKYRVLGKIGDPRWYGIATRKPDVELKAFFDRQIRNLKRTGQLAALQVKWFGFKMEVPNLPPDYAR